MTREITQRELRNDSGAIMRGLDRGEHYLVTRNGVPVGELRPVRRGRFVAADAVIGAFASGAAVEAGRFRTDVDRGIDQDPTPRA